jgi:hypothetical protein
MPEIYYLSREGLRQPGVLAGGLSEPGLRTADRHAYEVRVVLVAWASRYL